MLRDEVINELIGNKRFREYSRPIPNSDRMETLEVYRFDLHFRSLVMKALSVIEISLVTHLQNSGSDRKFSSFGDARRGLAEIAPKDQYVFATRFGLRNQRELKSCFIHLNHLRNRVAHHERVWNCQNKFSLPKVENSRILETYGVAKNPFVTAASMNLLVQMLTMLPPLFDFESEFEELLARTALDRCFLLKNMGFEVP